MKCRICGKEIEKLHEAPSGVYLCPEGSCFHEWRQHTKLGELTGNYIDKLAKALEEHFKTEFPPPEKYLEMREKRRVHYEWIQRYEKSMTEYIS